MQFLHWLVWRTTHRCYAQGCGRPLIIHTHSQLKRCINTPLAIQLADNEPDYSWQLVSPA